jgi:hypothetical protein
MGAIIAYHNSKQDKVLKFINKVKEYHMYLECKTERIDYGLEKGLAGYLHCLLLIQNKVYNSNLTCEIVEVVNRLLNDGLLENTVVR